MNLKEDEYLELVELELNPEDAIQFSVALWAEGLLRTRD